MRKQAFTVALTALGAVAVVLPVASGPQAAGTLTAAIEIPKSIREEHHEIHTTLVEATTAPGRVGVAARALAAVLDPHFRREEEIALPPLGLLAPLAAGTAVAEPASSDALAMTDALRREMPRMLEEHRAIRAAVAGLREAAVADRAAKYEQLADQLALHALTEEEVLYPAAVLVGLETS